LFANHRISPFSHKPVLRWSQFSLENDRDSFRGYYEVRVQPTFLAEIGQPDAEAGGETPAQVKKPQKHPLALLAARPTRSITLMCLLSFAITKSS
jgi:hypothetical protein